MSNFGSKQWANGKRPRPPGQTPANVAAHTPGPWHIEELGWVASDGKFVKSHPYVDIYPPADLPTGSRIPVASRVYPGDARLIAAAPDLLRVLKDVALFWAGGDCPAELWERIQATIALATEGTP